MKLSETEIGGLINTILRKTKTEGYHQSPNQVVKFSLEASTGQYAGSFSWGRLLQMQKTLPTARRSLLR